MKHRRERVAQEIRERLAEIVERRAADPRLAGVAITGVELSRDCSFARVFYRSLDPEEETAIALDRAKPFLRRSLARGLELRRVPEIGFVPDRSVERGARVEELLQEIAAARPAPDRLPDEEEPA
jgi:ribosome-binding factor A